MRIPQQPYRQRGVALFLSLIMLLMLTVLGISSFQNSHIQERSAGNARLQTVAFEAAAAGASNAINFFDANRELGDDQLCGALDHEGWDAATEWVTENGLDMGQGISLKQRMYCLADEYPDGGGRPARSQLFVLSRGEVITDGRVVAQRDVEVRLDIGGTGIAGDGCGALCFPGCSAGDFDFPNSDVFQVDGNGGPAITGGCSDMEDAINEGIRDNRIGNYLGGISSSTPGSPWDSPENTELFRVNVAAAAYTASQGDGACSNCYYPASHTDNGNTSYGTSALPQITYIHGDASFGGNISGAGIMFVNGVLDWNGTPNFQGLIVTLGGMFTIDGGGRGGDHAGSVVILNHPPLGEGEFGPSGFDNTGGGNALYRFDCGALQAAHALLDGTGQSLWTPECNTGPATPYDAGPTEMIIASWRENIGWREEFGEEVSAEEE